MRAAVVGRSRGRAVAAWQMSGAETDVMSQVFATERLQAHGGVKSPWLSVQQQSKIKRRQPRLPKQELNNGRFQQCTPPTGRCSLLGSVVHPDPGLSDVYGTRVPRLARVAYRPAEPACGRAQSEDVCWIRVPRLARVAYIAQLSRLVAVRRLKTNAPSELQGHRIIAHTSVSNMLLRFPFLFSFPSYAFSDKSR